jgi:gamma-D-glutamyl-L-lysine dipeptidyl-peptidase
MSEFGICNLSIVPCRKEASDKSEMVTQLLFGEHFEILRTHKSWVFIKLAHDGYECWIDKKQFQPISPQFYKKLNSAQPASADLIQVIQNTGENAIFPIVLGSTLPFYKDNECFLDKTKYSYEGQVVSKPSVVSGNIIETAFLYLNSPYLWGGRTPLGIDCSGFTQMVYRINGIQMPRDAYQQAEKGEILDFVEEARPGDLAFFDNEEGRIVHTGIVLAEQKIIHASGRVRIDKFDHHGIFNPEIKGYSHHLRLLKRIIK